MVKVTVYSVEATARGVRRKAVGAEGARRSQEVGRWSRDSGTPTTADNS